MTTEKPKLHEKYDLDSYRKGDYYSDEDDANVKKIAAWLEERRLSKDNIKRVSQAALARMARVGVSTLSQILNGSYNGSPSKQLAQVLSAISHAEDGEDNSFPVVETTVFKLAQTACIMARRHRSFSIFSGNVGTGKTKALKWYQANTSNVFLLEADPTMTPQTLVKELAKLVLGASVKGTNSALFAEIVAELKDTDSLLIFDEADTVTPKQLHLIRRLRDKANIGVVLAGTEYLHGQIQPVGGEFDQIRSRVVFWPPITQKITEEDAVALLAAGFPDEELPDDVIKRCWYYSKGSARMLCENLIAAVQQYRKNNPLSVELVDKIAQTALCLK